MIPFGLQAVVMFIDEFYFHRKRGLPKWEKIGHPLDSLTVFICYLYLSMQSQSLNHLMIYIGLCSFSCLFITKDEFVHSELCEAKENWLHSLLFVLHPVTFFCAGIIWFFDLNETLILIQPWIILAFAIYQFLYWSYRGQNLRRSS